MSTFKVFDIAGSGMAAQSVRLNTVASNLANANSVASDAASVYKARHPVFEAVRNATAAGTDAGAAVRVRGIVESQAPALARYEPGNPLADANGYVYAPNVNAVEQMVDMISASRSYQNNVEVMNASRDMLLATLRIGQCASWTRWATAPPPRRHVRRRRPTTRPAASARISSSR
jgi:flagellar basal-body rod protein FlgC